MTDKEKWFETWVPSVGLEEAEAAWAVKEAGVKRQAAMVMPDIQPYRSMIDGSIIESRSKHRSHLKAHGCIEIGNEKQTPKTVTPPTGLKDRLIEVANSKLRY